MAVSPISITTAPATEAVEETTGGCGCGGCGCGAGAQEDTATEVESR